MNMSFCPLTTLSQLKLLSTQLKTLLSAQLDKSVGVDFNNASNMGLEFCAWIRQFCNTLYTPEKKTNTLELFFFVVVVIIIIEISLDELT